MQYNTPTLARSIAIADNIICVSGFVYDKKIEHMYATFWINGVEQRLSNNTDYGEVCKNANSKDDVYILLNEYHPYFTSPKYWKNGKETYFEHYNNISFASDIFIVQK